MRCITWFSFLQMRKQGSLNTKSRTKNDSEKLILPISNCCTWPTGVLPLFRQWEKNGITIQYSFPLNMHFSESTAHWCPILHLYLITTFPQNRSLQQPSGVRAGRPLQHGSREDRAGAGWACVHLPGSTAAYPSSSFYLPSSSFHKNYFRKLFTNSFKIFENAVKQIYVKEPETRGTILNFPRRTGKPSLTEFFPPEELRELKLFVVLYCNHHFK